MPRTDVLPPAHTYTMTVAVLDPCGASVTTLSLAPWFASLSCPRPPDAFLICCPLGRRRLAPEIGAGRNAPKVYGWLGSAVARSFAARRIRSAEGPRLSSPSAVEPAQYFPPS